MGLRCVTIHGRNTRVSDQSGWGFRKHRIYCKSRKRELFPQGLEKATDKDQKLFADVAARAAARAAAARGGSGAGGKVPAPAGSGDRPAAAAPETRGDASRQGARPAFTALKTLDGTWTRMSDYNVSDVSIHSNELHEQGILAF